MSSATVSRRLPFPRNSSGPTRREGAVPPTPAAHFSGGALCSEGRGDGALSEKDRRRAEAEARNARYRLERPLREEIARLEARVEALEADEREATAALADPALYQDFARAKPFIDRQRAAKEELETLYAAWEEAQGRLAAIG